VAIEIEKKYRLTPEQRSALIRQLRDIGAQDEGEELEENTLYEGGPIDFNRNVLRLRRVGDAAVLTYKERLSVDSHAKHQREEETEVVDAEAMRLILEAIGFIARLVYEKRRQTWLVGETEIVVDELPFGLFMEIEGTEEDILAVERELGIENLQMESSTYPQLTRKLGKRIGEMIEARFESQE
jgi:adenylate cyclase class 2